VEPAAELNQAGRKQRGLQEGFETTEAVFRIHDILVRIRIRGSMPLTNGSGCGSGSCYFHHYLQDANKKQTKKIMFFCLILFECTFTYFSKIKRTCGSGGSRSGFGSGSGTLNGRNSYGIYNSPAGRLTDDENAVVKMVNKCKEWTAKVANMTIQEEIPANQNDAWTCLPPIYMEDWSRRAK
jgi:hypothetical protein